MSEACLIEKLYDCCADEEGGGGGVEPMTSDWFPPLFTRERRISIEDLPKSSISRKVQIRYLGVDSYGKFGVGRTGRRTLFLAVDVVVGYHKGDHADESQIVIMSDDTRLQRWFIDPANRPSCDGVCVHAVEVKRSRVETLSDSRCKLVITLQLQVF